MKKFIFILSLALLVIIFPFTVFAGGGEPFDFEHGAQQSLNKWVARTGAEVYRLLNNDDNFDYPGGSKTSDFSTASVHWGVMSGFMDPSVDFIKETGVPASEALQSLLTSKGRFDCRIAQKIVFLECIRKLIGVELFNDLGEQFETEFSKDLLANKSTKDLWLCGSKSLNPYLRLTSQDKGSLYNLGRVGYSGYFGYTPNIEEYAELHPEGRLRGDNGLLCLREDEEKLFYTGFGSFYKAGGCSWDEMVLRFKKKTLTLPVLEEPVIDASEGREDREEWYIDWMKDLDALDASDLQKKKELTTALESEYEEKFNSLQILFRGPAFFIDLEKVKQAREKFESK